MNKNADYLNMNSTHFSNPHGLCSKENRSTAEDIGKLAFNLLSCAKLKEVVNTIEYEAAVYNHIKKSFRINK